MKVGMNLFLWTDDPVDEAWLPLYGRLKAMGFDGIELPIFDPDPEKFAVLGRHLDDLGLARTAVTICNPEDDPLSPDPAIRTAGTERLCRVVDCCEAAGVETLAGPLYAAIGQFSGAGPTNEEWQRSLEVIGAVADHAARIDLRLAFEFLNRFEIYLLNTAADTARYVRALDRPNVGVHYDTFHAHIEEKSIPEAIRSLSGCLAHVHISENDRSTPGSGNVRWDANFDTLNQIGYDNLMVIEAFGLALEKLVPATKIWRRMYQSERQLATDGLAFMKAEVAKRWG